MEYIEIDCLFIISLVNTEIKTILQFKYVIGLIVRAMLHSANVSASAFSSQNN